MSTFIDIVSKLFRLNKYQKNKLKGVWGEMKVTFGLKMLLSVEYKLFNDVLIELPNNKYSQIDHVVISPYGIYVIETKNYQGQLTINNSTNTWVQTLSKVNYEFYDPIIQNEGHIQALEFVLEESGLPIFSMVCFVGHGAFTNQFIPEEIEIGVLSLIKAIKKNDIQVIAPNHSSNLATKLKKQRLINSKQNKQLHVDYVNKIQSN